ncbi:MAG: ATP-binding protein, partial [Candidatus Rokuibacteriota bacterium]
MADQRSRLASVLREHEPYILSEWIGLLAKTGRSGDGDKAQLEEHARSFVRLLADAVQADASGSIDGSAWGKTRDMLASLSATRARQGFTPSETAAFIFSLKEPLFGRLRGEYRADPECLARELWTATLLLDGLALWTIEVFQKRREEVIRAASRGWQATFDAIGDGICLLAAEGVVSRCNGAFGDLLGRSGAEAVGMPWAEVWRRVGDAEEASPLGRVHQSRRRETVDFARGPRWLRLLVDPVLDGDTVTGMVCIVSDITIERQATEVRAALFAREQEAREEAEASNRSKDEFLAMLGHELRNPLNVIGSAVGVLDSRPEEDAAALQARAVIGRQVRQLGRLVDDLLDVGRVTTGKITLVRVPVDLAETARRCATGLTASGRPPQHRISVRAEPTWVDADQARLEQIVTNLLSNAVKYTPTGGEITVTVGGDGQTARLSVADTGAGLAPQVIERVFDLFFQGERTLDRAEGGLGIGLTLVRRLAELHGGRVAVASEGLGRGSTFSVEMPRIAGPGPASPASDAPSAPRPRRILIVEDSQDSRDMLR